MPSFHYIAIVALSLPWRHTTTVSSFKVMRINMKYMMKVPFIMTLGRSRRIRSFSSGMSCFREVCEGNSTRIVDLRLALFCDNFCSFPSSLVQIAFAWMTYLRIAREQRTTGPNELQSRVWVSNLLSCLENDDSRMFYNAAFLNTPILLKRIHID
jgi:hypothetical protein